ncbi:hypothetical protein RvY_03499 [Ramazzottius varieornatus]|uniref:PiggyBac transposable element-derived protein 4 C-terminal zinc-ribbon domain-containing protein n=1 Tax=Ramazzottius varieornatus TaxID=947166 RepID=A0A1D1UXM7_RAMVA|nr:hypothetical protein RvY_03499 [Ramazzottius varieornatus]
MKSHPERRRYVVNLPLATKSVINKALKVSTVVGLNVDPPAQGVLQHTPTGSKVQRRCQLCPRSTDKKTRAVCSFCNIPVCELHHKSIETVTCFECQKNGFTSY